MAEKFEAQKFDVKRKLQTFLESYGGRFEEADPWADENFRGMCMRHNFTEGDIRALTDEIKAETRRQIEEKKKWAKR